VLLDFRAIAIFDAPISPILFLDRSNTSRDELLVIADAIDIAPSMPRFAPLSLSFLSVVLISNPTHKEEAPLLPIGLLEKSNDTKDLLLASAHDIFVAPLWVLFKEK